MTSDISFPIKTTRLIIRSYRPDDAAWYYQMSLKNREHLSRYEPNNPVMSIMTESDAKKTIEDFISLWDEQKYRFMGVFLKGSDDFVAQIYLGKLNDQLPEFGIGYIVNEAHEGNGYVTEAVSAVVKELFKKVEAHRIQIETDDTNIRSIGVAKRCGFVREGHLRKNRINPDRTYSGTLLFGLLREEYSE
ncbi:MAG: N-acetyltransferase [Candidatus Thorarchaeota archaeon]|nr:MAG: N-acetyltransferase [Candidatus Thorarchaeota archaeon]